MLNMSQKHNMDCIADINPGEKIHTSFFIQSLSPSLEASLLEQHEFPLRAALSHCLCRSPDTENSLSKTLTRPEDFEVQYTIQSARLAVEG
jgi:hypothetical protein